MKQKTGQLASSKQNWIIFLSRLQTKVKVGIIKRVQAEYRKSWNIFSSLNLARVEFIFRGHIFQSTEPYKFQEQVLNSAVLKFFDVFSILARVPSFRISQRRFLVCQGEVNGWRNYHIYSAVSVFILNETPSYSFSYFTLTKANSLFWKRCRKLSVLLRHFVTLFRSIPTFCKVSNTFFSCKLYNRTIIVILGSNTGRDNSRNVGFNFFDNLLKITVNLCNCLDKLPLKYPIRIFLQSCTRSTNDETSH